MNPRSFVKNVMYVGTYILFFDDSNETVTFKAIKFAFTQLIVSIILWSKSLFMVCKTWGPGQCLAVLLFFLFFANCVEEIVEYYY